MKLMCCHSSPACSDCPRRSKEAPATVATVTVGQRVAPRPEDMAAFVGQEPIVGRLRVLTAAALKRGELPGHILLSGPPGYGKTSLARIVAQEIGSGLIPCSGSTLRKVDDLVGVLRKIEPGDVLFVDEIHRLPRAVEEALYEPLEDGTVTIMLGAGKTASPTRARVHPFVLVGATTRPGKLSEPLRDRFAYHGVMQPYSVEELTRIVAGAWERSGLSHTPVAAKAVAERSKGVPRIALRLADIARDVASLDGRPLRSEEAMKALQSFGVSEGGLDEVDRRILVALVRDFDGGPVGLDNLAGALGFEQDVIAEEAEPWLIRAGLVVRESRGRCITPRGAELVMGWEAS